MEFNVFLLAKYPFLPEARGFLTNYFDVNLADLMGEEYKGAIERAFERVTQAIRHRRIIFETSNMIDYKAEIISFPIAVSLVAALNDDMLRQIFATAEAKKCFELMRMGDSEEVLKVAKAMNFPIILDNWEGRQTLFMNISDYLRYSPQNWGPPWKLVNRRIHNGRVMVLFLEVARLLEESIKDLIVERTRRNVNYEDFPGPLIDRFQLLVREWKSYKVRIVTRIVEERRDVPPCMVRLLSRQEKGENLSHVERRTLATYLIATGRTIEELMDTFKTSPDFNERIARYQIEHLAGLRGRKQRYLTPSCKTMRVYGLCFPDQWCDGIKHPLRYKIG